MPKPKKNSGKAPDSAAAKTSSTPDYVAEYCYQLKSGTHFSDLDHNRVQAFITLLQHIAALDDQSLHALVKASTNQEDAAALLALLATTPQTQLAAFLANRQLPWLILLSSIAARGQAFLGESYQKVRNTVHQPIETKLAALVMPRDISQLFALIRTYSPFRFLYDHALTEQIFGLIKKYQLEEPTKALVGANLFSIGCDNNNTTMLRYAFSHRLFPDHPAEVLSFSGIHHAPLALAGLETHPKHAEEIKTKLQGEYDRLTAEAATMNPHVALSIWALLQQLYPQAEERAESCITLMTALAANAANLSLTDILTHRVSNLPLILWLQNQPAFVETAKQIADLTPLIIKHTDIDPGSQKFLATCASLELLDPTTFIQRILIKFALATRGLAADKIITEHTLPYLKLLLCILEHPHFVITENYLQQVLLLAVLTNQAEDLKQLAQRAPDLFQRIIGTNIPESALSTKFKVSGIRYIELALRHRTADCAPFIYQTLITQNAVAAVSRPAHLLSALVTARSFSGILALLRQQPHFFMTAALRSALFQLYQEHPDAANNTETIARSLVNIGYLLYPLFHLQAEAELPWKDTAKTEGLLTLLIQYLEQLPEAAQIPYCPLLAHSRKNLALIQVRAKPLTEEEAALLVNPDTTAHHIALRLHALTAADSAAAVAERQRLISQLETLLLHLPNNQFAITAHPCQIADQAVTADFIALLCLGHYLDLVKLALLCLPHYLFSELSYSTHTSTNILSAVCTQDDTAMADIVSLHAHPDNLGFDLLTPSLSPDYRILHMGSHPPLQSLIQQWQKLPTHREAYLDTVSPMGLLQLFALLHYTIHTVGAEENDIKQSNAIRLAVQGAFKRKIPEDTQTVQLKNGTSIASPSLALALAADDPILINEIIDAEYAGKIPIALRPHLFDLLLTKPYEPLWLKLEVTTEDLLTTKEDAVVPTKPLEHLLSACTASRSQKNKITFASYLHLIRESLLRADLETDPAILTEFLVLLDTYLEQCAARKLAIPLGFREVILTKVLKRIAYNPEKIIWENLDPRTPFHLQKLLLMTIKNPDHARFLLQIDKHLLHQQLKNLSLDELCAFVPKVLPRLSCAEEEIYQPYVCRALIAAHRETPFQLLESHFINPFFVAAVFQSGVPVDYAHIPIQHFCRVLAQNELLVDEPPLTRAIQGRIPHLTAADDVMEAIQILCAEGEQALATELVNQEQVPVHFRSAVPLNHILSSSCTLNFGGEFFQPLMSAFLKSQVNFNGLALGTESGFSPFAMVMIEALSRNPEHIADLLIQMLPDLKKQFEQLDRYGVVCLLQLIEFSRRCQAEKLTLRADVQQYLNTLDLKAFRLLTSEHKENYADLLISIPTNHPILSIFAVNAEEFLAQIGGHHIASLFFMAICYGYHDLLDIIEKYLNGKYLSFNPYAEKIWLNETVARSPVDYLYTQVQAGSTHAGITLQKLFRAYPPTESQRTTWAVQLQSSTELLIALYHHAEEKQQAEIISHFPEHNFSAFMRIALTLKQERFIAFLLNSLFAAKTAKTIPLFQRTATEQLAQFNLSELAQLGALTWLPTQQRDTISNIEEQQMQKSVQDTASNRAEKKAQNLGQTPTDENKTKKSKSKKNKSSTSTATTEAGAAANAGSQLSTADQPSSHSSSKTNTTATDSKDQATTTDAEPKPATAAAAVSPSRPTTPTGQERRRSPTLFAPHQQAKTFQFDVHAPAFVPKPKSTEPIFFPAVIAADNCGLFIDFLQNSIPYLEVTPNERLYLTCCPNHLQYGACEIYFDSIQTKWFIRQLNNQLFPITLATASATWLSITTYFNLQLANGAYQTIKSEISLGFPELKKTTPIPNSFIPSF